VIRCDPCHICTGTALTPATSAPGLGSPLPHLHRDCARPGHICAGTGLTPATSALGLASAPGRDPTPCASLRERGMQWYAARCMCNRHVVCATGLARGAVRVLHCTFVVRRWVRSAKAFYNATGVMK
jgi:hypothetical protein